MRDISVKLFFEIGPVVQEVLFEDFLSTALVAILLDRAGLFVQFR